jgi:hypothetical protein
MTDDERHTIAAFRSMQAGLHINIRTSPQVGGGIAIPSNRARRHLAVHGISSQRNPIW